MTVPQHNLFLPAATAVVSRADDVEVWLAKRRTMVTASESAHLLGIYSNAPFGLTWPELADRKRDPGKDRVSGYAHAGRWWEGPNIEWFEACSGLMVRGLDCLYRSEERPFMGATPDGLLVGLGDPDPELVEFLTYVDEFDVYEGAEAAARLKERVQNHDRVLVEAKHQRSKSRSRWNKPGKLNPAHRCQATHQMSVVDADLNLVVAKVDANELYVHAVEREAEYEGLLVGSCERFAEKYL